MKAIDKFTFPIWLGFIVFSIVYFAMNILNYQPQLKSRFLWEDLGIEIASVVDSCKDVPKLGYVVYFKTPKVHLCYLSLLERKIVSGDSVFKPAGTMTFHIYKKCNPDSCIIVKKEVFMPQEYEDCDIFNSLTE